MEFRISLNLLQQMLDTPMSKKFLIGDYIISGCLILIAILIVFSYVFRKSDEKYAEVWKDNKLVYSIKLSEDTHERFEVSGQTITNTIKIQGFSAYFEHSDCYDEVCVRTGAITSVGRAAVCLPNHVILKITGQVNDDEVDIIAS